MRVPRNVGTDQDGTEGMGQGVQSERIEVTVLEAKAIYCAAGGPMDQDDQIGDIAREIETVVTAPTDRIAGSIIRWWDCWTKRNTATAFARRARAQYQVLLRKQREGYPDDGSRLCLAFCRNGERALCWVRKDGEIQFPEFSTRWHYATWVRANGWRIRPICIAAARQSKAAL